MTRIEAISALRQAVEGCPNEELPALVGEIALAQARAIERAQGAVVVLPNRHEGEEGAKDGGDVLTVDQVAERLQRSRWWVYRHKHELPAVRLPGGRLGFPERRIERWLARRATS